MQLLVCSLQDLQIGPPVAGQPRRVFAPQLRRAILVGDVGIFQPLGLDDAMRPVFRDCDEIGFVVTQIAGIIRVLDRKPELFRQLCKALDIRRLLQKLRELPLKIVQAWD